MKKFLLSPFMSKFISREDSQRTVVLPPQRKSLPSLIILPLVFGLMVGAGRSSAQAQSLPGPATPPKAVTPKAAGPQVSRNATRPQSEEQQVSTSYRLGPQDVLKVTVEDYEQFSHDNVPVLPNGTIILPVYGTVNVNNQTISHVQATLRSRLAQRMRNPRLTVSVVQTRPVPPISMYVNGAVRNPGKVKISQGSRLTDVLDAVGGVQGPIEEVQATLTRVGRPPIPVSLNAAVTQPLSTADLQVRANDTLTVRLTPKYMFVVGAVKTPGKQQISGDARLTDVLAAAGGVAGQLEEAQAVLARTGQPPVTVDLNEAISQPLSDANLQVRANDTLTIRLAPRYMFVVGAVKTPGKQPISGDYRLTDALMAAGGVQGRLEEVQAVITRPGQPPLRVDLNEAVLHPTSQANARVQPLDTLTITEQETARINVIGEVLSPGTFELHRVPRPNSNELPLQPRLSDAIKVAGGIKYTAEGAGGVTEQRFSGSIYRNNQEIPVQLEEALEGKDGAANPALLPGDLVTIKAVAPLEIVVEGSAVRTPGPLKLPVGSGVLDAIVKSNGLTRPADKVVASIWRSGKTLPLDLSRAWQTDDPRANPPLEDKDVVQLNEPQSIQVQLTGNVGKPAAIRLPLNASMMDAMVQAGGLTVKPETARISILRNQQDGGWKSLAVNPVKLLSLDPAENIRLQEGDFIDVGSVEAAKKSAVFIRGEVAKSGFYELQDEEGLDKVILRAGGTTADAALTKVSVKRNDTTHTIDLHAAITEGSKLDFPLQDGDFIIVPKIDQRVLVMEAVNKPGYISIPEKAQLTVFDAVSMAGGLRGDAKKGEVVVLRKAGTEVQKQVVSLDLINNGDKGGKELLKSGDVVYVPARNAKPGFLSKIISTVSTLGIFGLLPF